MAEVGQAIRITRCDDPYHSVDYVGRVGIITIISRDPYDRSAEVLYGTWGSCSICRQWGDDYELIDNKKSRTDKEN